MYEVVCFNFIINYYPSLCKAFSEQNSERVYIIIHTDYFSPVGVCWAYNILLSLSGTQRRSKTMRYKGYRSKKKYSL